ncbi:MAG: midcut-by-XrtH protein [Pseudomonadota bacterium]
MGIRSQFMAKTLAAALLCFAGPAMAGQSGAIITFQPLGGVGVPALGAIPLIALASLLALVAFRLLKERRKGGTSAVVAAATCAALAAGSGGIVLIEGAQAGAAGRGTLTLGIDDQDSVIDISNSSGAYMIVNGTELTQRISSITTDGGCIILRHGAGPPPCSIGTVLAPGESCNLDLACGAS